MNEKDQDPRLGLPSASSALQDQLCLGRWRKQREYLAMVESDTPDEDESGSSNNGSPTYDLDKDAEAGKRIHKLYARQECPEATSPERERAEHGLRIDEEMGAKWRQIFIGMKDVKWIEYRERRWWLKDSEGNPVYSGQTDVVWIRGNPGSEADILVGDLKGLWGYHDPATLNVQLRRYIALIAANIEGLGYTRVVSACAYLNQPAKTLKPVMAKYEEDDIMEAILEMWTDLANMQDPDAPRTPGPVQCHHCKGKLICEEYLNQTEKQILRITPELPDKKAIEYQLSRLPGDKLAQLLPWFDALEDLVALGKSEAKRRLRVDPAGVPGFMLKKNSPRRRIEEIVKVYTRLNAAYGTTSDEILKMCTTSISDIQEHVREKSGLKGKALEEKVNGVLDGATVPVPVSDSLVPDK